MTSEHINLRNRAASLSLVCNILLTALKIVGAVTTGSVSLLSDAVHSATDIVASSISFVSVRVSMVPPDETHPYGHGKIETLAGLSEAILLLCVVGYLGFESVHRLIRPEPVQNAQFGIWLMAISAVVSLVVGRFVAKAGVSTKSDSLKSNGQHFLVDFWTSVGVLAALVINHLSNWDRTDGVVGLGLSLWLGYGAWQMAVRASNELIDRRIEDHELANIEAILTSDEGVLSYHRLRTRHSGAWHYVDVHVVVPRDWSVVQAHDLADRLEKDISATLSPCHVVIHIDPYDEEKAARGR